MLIDLTQFKKDKMFRLNIDNVGFNMYIDKEAYCPDCLDKRYKHIIPEWDKILSQIPEVTSIEKIGFDEDSEPYFLEWGIEKNGPLLRNGFYKLELELYNTKVQKDFSNEIIDSPFVKSEKAYVIWNGFNYIVYQKFNPSKMYSPDDFLCREKGEFVSSFLDQTFGKILEDNFLHQCPMPLGALDLIIIFKRGLPHNIQPYYFYPVKKIAEYLPDKFVLFMPYNINQDSDLPNLIKILFESELYLINLIHQKHFYEERSLEQLKKINLISNSLTEDLIHCNSLPWYSTIKRRKIRKKILEENLESLKLIRRYRYNLNKLDETSKSISVFLDRKSAFYHVKQYLEKSHDYEYPFVNTIFSEFEQIQKPIERIIKSRENIRTITISAATFLVGTLLKYWLFGF